MLSGSALPPARGDQMPRKSAMAAACAAVESWTAIPHFADAISAKGVWDPLQRGQPAAKPKPQSAKAAQRDVSRVD